MRRYTLAQLDALRYVVKFRSFQAAADHLNVTQPTISLRIRELESIMGYPLLRRSGGRGELTAEGTVFYQYVEQLAQTLSEIDRRVRTRDPLSGVLRLGASDTFAIACLPELLSEMEKNHPNLRVELTIARSTILAELLNTKMLDLAFMAEVPLEPNICAYPLAYCHMAWCGRSDGRGHARPMTVSDLENERLMTLPANAPLHDYMLRWFELAGRPMPPVSICNSLAMILRLVNAGHGWSILPECFALSDETRIHPTLAMVVPELPMLKLCAACRDESGADTLLPVISLAKGMLLRKPGLLPLE